MEVHGIFSFCTFERGQATGWECDSVFGEGVEGLVSEWVQEKRLTLTLTALGM